MDSLVGKFKCNSLCAYIPQSSGAGVIEVHSFDGIINTQSYED